MTVPRLRQSKIDGLDVGAVPTASTINTSTGCFHYGGELGSTDVVKTELRGRRANGLNRKKIDNCKRQLCARNGTCSLIK